MPDKPALVYPPTFWALVEQVASTEPDGVILGDDRGRRLTNGGYRDACEATAAALCALGVGPDTAVSWQLPTVLEALVVKGALSRIGAVQNPIIPILRRREVAFITAQTKAELLIVPGVWRGFDYTAMAEDVAAEVGFAVLTMAGDDALNAFGLALPVGDPSTLPPPPAHLAPAELPDRWIYYSSGTTSDPKGGRHTDQSVMAGASGVLGSMGVREDDVVPMPFPIAHIGGICMLTTALVSRCRTLLVETFDGERSPLVFAEHGASLLGSAVPFFHAYLAAQRKHGPERLYPRIRACISGGAPKPPELHYEIQRELGGRGIVSSYGLTEFPIATYCTFDDSDEMLAMTEGRASPGVDIRVVDFDEHECGPGEEGELRVKGPQMIRGYVDKTLDADAFDSQGFFRTGDLGVVEPSGHVRITGRSKDVIIRNAENISAQEIENVLYTHPKITDVAVIGLPDARTGERCCSVIVLAAGESTLTLADLAQHCAANGLAKQKVPEQIEIVDELPRNAMGKILKQELRALTAVRADRKQEPTMGQFDGKVAIVTGASSGIGRASVKLFAQHGAAVIASDVDDAGGEATVAQARAAGGEATFVHTDVSSPEQVEAMVTAAIRNYGRLDFAHNNAGIPGAGATVPDTSIDDWRRAIDVMLTGVFLGMKYEIPRILEHGQGGAIVNTSSGAGLIGFPGMCGYVASKHGVIGLTKTAALEFGAQGIRINAICPGTARTGMVEAWMGDDAALEAQVVALHPIGRIAEPIEIAQAAIWLCSDAASFMIGAVIPVDGGYVAQ